MSYWNTATVIGGESVVFEAFLSAWRNNFFLVGFEELLVLDDIEIQSTEPILVTIVLTRCLTLCPFAVGSNKLCYQAVRRLSEL
ncbi:hypothetical protein GQ457_05G010390 [Hibiscus cannabinus]